MNSSANVKEDSLDLTQQVIEEQQEHLVSDYQCQSDMISTSVETEGKRPDDLLFGPRVHKEKSEPNICSIKQQHSIRNDTMKDSVKDTRSKSNTTSQQIVSAKEESLDSRQVLSSPQKDAPLALETTNLSSRENPKQNNLEQTYVERDISYRSGKLSSQEQADGSDHIENGPSEVASSARDVHSPAFSHSSPNDWRRLEQELTEFLSDLEIHDEIIPHDSAAAELNVWWKRDSEPPCDRIRSQTLPQLDRQREDEEDDIIVMDESKPPANISNDDVA
jgi:hypothetical protein